MKYFIECLINVLIDLLLIVSSKFISAAVNAPNKALEYSFKAIHWSN